MHAACLSTNHCCATSILSSPHFQKAAPAAAPKKAATAKKPPAPKGAKKAKVAQEKPQVVMEKKTTKKRKAADKGNQDQVNYNEKITKIFFGASEMVDLVNRLFIQLHFSCQDMFCCVLVFVVIT